MTGRPAARWAALAGVWSPADAALAEDGHRAGLAVEHPLERPQVVGRDQVVVLEGAEHALRHCGAADDHDAPAEQSGGLAKIKSMSAPFPMFKVMPTGGVNLKNLKEYLSSPIIAACGGSYMVTADLIDNQKWDEIIELCKKSREIVKEARK